MNSLSQQAFIDWSDQYLLNELSEVERLRFEQFCAENSSYALQFEAHKDFLATLKQADARQQFKQKLNQVAQDSTPKVEGPGFVKAKIIPLWDNLRLNAAMAAAIAIVSAFGTLWFSGYYKTLKKASSDFSALRRDMNNVKRNVNAHNAAIKSINNPSKTNESLQYGATGFMLTKDGYVVTNYHVINGADSIFLQNQKGEVFKAQAIFTNAEKDLAILHINDSSFTPAKNVPYTFKKNDSDLGEEIYTIGFPRDEAVYGQGYLSSSTGYAGDTLAYQISIPVNPGNSGGPVLDNKGNIIGIISGKQKGIDGAAFAIKTKALLETLNSIPAELLEGNIVLNNKNNISTLSRTDQIKKLQDYIYIVKVY